MEFRFFREDLCDRCGLCFQRCPVLELPVEEAKQEIKALIRGEAKASLALQQCTTCDTCDLVCPVTASPYELILERWNEENRAKGLHPLARFVFPNEPGNVWSSLRALMGEDELSLVRSWRENMTSPRKVMLLTGFYTNLIPYVARTSLLDELKPAIAGFEGLWGCAGDAYKLGMLGASAEIASMVKQRLAEMGVEKLYCFMDAEAMMLSDVLPHRFGIDFTFCAPEPLDSWIMDGLNSGRIAIKQKLNMKVTVHDSCCSKYREGRIQEVTREMMERIGCPVVEMEHNRQSSLCCGWAATIPTLHGPSGSPLPTLLYLLDSLYRRLEEAEATGAEGIVASCHACYIFLSVIKALTSSKIEVYLPLELVQMAAGETPLHKNERRAGDIVAVFANALFKWFFIPKERRRFFPRPVKMESVSPLGSGDARRIRFFAKIYHSIMFQNPLSRRLTGTMLKASIRLYRRSRERRKRKIIALRAKE